MDNRSNYAASGRSSLRYFCYFLPVIFLATVGSLYYTLFTTNEGHLHQTNPFQIQSNSVLDHLSNIALAQQPQIDGQHKVLGASDKYAAGQLRGASKDDPVKVVSARLFDEMLATALAHPRKRKMVDLTKQPEQNSLQVLVNTWTNGSFSPVHRHDEYSEAFVVLDGALAFFTFNDNGQPTCHVLHNLPLVSDSDPGVRALIVEKQQWHAMTAAPPELGYPGHAIIFENSGHYYDVNKPTKVLAPFAPVYGDGMNGDPTYFKDLLTHCPRYQKP